MTILAQIKTIPARLGTIWHQTDPLPLELLSALTAITWAIVLGLAFSSFDGEPRYALLEFAASERTWAVLMLILGGAQIIRILWFKRAAHILHMFLTGTAFIIWVYIAVSILSAVPTPPGGTIYAVLAASNVWIFLRAGIPPSHAY